jgi:type IV conjugative transfer system pilin TraA
MSQATKAMTKLNNFGLNAYVQFKIYLPYIALGVILFMLCSGHAFADDTDYLAGSTGAVAKTFGEGSSFEKYLYLGEAILGVFGYIKTKNILTLAGIPIVMIFTKVFFSAVTG